MERRAFLSAAALAPLAACASGPAYALAPSTEFRAILDSFITIRDRYCAAPSDCADDLYGVAYDDAFARIVAAQPPTGDDFVRKFLALNGEDPSAIDMTADARRLVS